MTNECVKVGNFPQFIEMLQFGKNWKIALLFAVPITAVFLILTAYWFALADRYIVFLYYHDMGAIVPDTSPFSSVTASRYWMTGFVSGGLIMVLYTATNWLWGRFQTDYVPPPWQQVWLICTLPLTTIIPLIVMTANVPSLPLWNAMQVTAAVLAALALALLPGWLAARRPWQLLWLISYGLGLAFLLTTLLGLQNISRWQASGSLVYLWLMGVVTAVTLLWLFFLTGWRRWQRQPSPGVLPLMLAGFCVAYLFLPLLHYTLFTDGYFYITNSSNFFARTFWMQMVVWGVTAALVWLVNTGIGSGD
ncbi:MAG: hypothetical protein GY796_16655 [Chloroflexi bacterium]|nr:hypothetical protein [Chloroflexota bacterium]